MKDENPDRSVPESANKPAITVRPGKPYMVQCLGFRCVAVMDTDGHWRSHYSNMEIKGPVTVLREV